MNLVTKQVVMNRAGETFETAKRTIAQELMPWTCQDPRVEDAIFRALRASGGSYGEPVYIEVGESQAIELAKHGFTIK